MRSGPPSMELVSKAWTPKSGMNLYIADTRSPNPSSPCKIRESSSPVTAPGRSLQRTSSPTSTPLLLHLKICCEHLIAPQSNNAINRLIELIEHVAARTSDPLLLTGPTGAGKSRLAGRIYELRRHKRLVAGKLVEVNCATLRRDGAMSALCGHKKGAFTGVMNDRPGLLRSADGGMLFLDEIGALGLDEQAMLLRAIEEKRFLPVGADSEVHSNFQLIAGTNRDLPERVRSGFFREDLLARINIWTFRLPGLCDRAEDIEPNIQYELERYARERVQLIRFSSEARSEFLRFATGPSAAWMGNFRDLGAALTRMATLAPGGRISSEIVREEIERLNGSWHVSTQPTQLDGLEDLLGEDRLNEIDRFDRVQLAEVVSSCRASESLSEAGR